MRILVAGVVILLFIVVIVSGYMCKEELLRFIRASGSIDKPGWYEPIRAIHYHGSQYKDHMGDFADNE